MSINAESTSAHFEAKNIPQAAPPGPNALPELGLNQHLVSQKHKSLLEKWIEETAESSNIGGG